MHNPEDVRGGAFEIGLAFLAGLALLLYLAKIQVEDLKDDLRIQRRRRRQLEETLRTRDDQLDGALAKIHELHGDDGDHDASTEPEPAS